ncbi:MAG: carotenoid biosynthesis protein [Acidobacteriota bacterium]
MMARRIILTTLASCYVVLWIGGVGSHVLFGRAPDGAVWAAPVFLLLAGLITLLTAHRSAQAALLTASGLGLAAEVIGVRYGFPFGSYVYTATLQPQLFGVPLVMACAWMVLVAYVKDLPAGFKLPAWVEVPLLALWMTMIDLLIDPLAANQLDYWHWAEPGWYYGIPVQNFFGWFAVSLLIFAVIRLLNGSGRQPNPWARWTGFSILLFFTCIAFAHRLAIAGSIGAMLCLTTAIIGNWPASKWSRSKVENLL